MTEEMTFTDVVAKNSEYSYTDKFSFIFSKLWNFFWPIIACAMTRVGQAAIASIQAAVVEAEGYYGPGEGGKKFDFALDKVKSDLSGQGFLIGVDIGIKLINALINMEAQKVS